MNLLQLRCSAKDGVEGVFVSSQDKEVKLCPYWLTYILKHVSLSVELSPQYNSYLFKKMDEMCGSHSYEEKID